MAEILTLDDLILLHVYGCPYEPFHCTDRLHALATNRVTYLRAKQERMQNEISEYISRQNVPASPTPRSNEATKFLE